MEKKVGILNLEQILRQLDLWSDNIDFQPDLLEVHKETEDLVKLYGFPGYPLDLTKLTNYVYPYLDKKTAILANHWIMWLFVTDDFIDNPDIEQDKKNRLIDELVAVLNGACEPRYPQSKLLVHILSLLPESLIPILIQTTLDYLRLGIVEKSLTLDLSVDDYKRIRYYDSACETVYPIMFLDRPECANLFNSENKKLMDEATTLICITNDIASYNKDTIRDKTTFNHVCLLMKEKNITLEVALELLIEEANKAYLKLLTLPGDSLMRERLIIWCEADLYWHNESKRFIID